MFLYSSTCISITWYPIFSASLLHVSERKLYHCISCSITKLICSVWHITIQMLIACRQQMRWHTVIIITDKLEIFIFCRQRPAVLTFQLFSWDCPVYDQYSSYPAGNWAMRSEFLFSFTTSSFSSSERDWTLQAGLVCVCVCWKPLCFWN